MARNNRDFFSRISPPWLRAYWGERFTGTVALFFDLLSEAATQAIKAPWINADTSPADALPDMGADANIDQAPGESLDEFRARLRNKWTLWGESATLRFADNSMAPYGIDPDAVTVYTRNEWALLNPDNWSRFWVVIDDTVGDGAEFSLRLWDASTSWGSAGTWGTDATPEQVAGVLRVLCKWKSAHEIGVELVFLFDGGHLWGAGSWGAGRSWGADDYVIRWPLGRFWGAASVPQVWGDQSPYDVTQPATWGGKI